MSTKAAAATQTLPSTSVILDRVMPKKGSVRLKVAEGEKNAIISDVYLSRANALLGRNIPEGHVPTKVEVTVRVLETAPEASLPAAS
jgi:hypothetical protein